MQIMENRRLEGRDKILKKLRTNQDFMMATTLSPKAHVWTRWHAERALNNEMERDTSGSRNERYLNIIREIVLDLYQPKLLDWAFSMSEQNKKVSLQSLTHHAKRDDATK